MITNGRETKLAAIGFNTAICYGEGTDQEKLVRPIHASITVFSDGSREVGCTFLENGRCQLAEAPTKCPHLYPKRQIQEHPVLPTVIPSKQIIDGWKEIRIKNATLVAKTSIVWKFNAYAAIISPNGVDIRLTPRERDVFDYLWKNHNYPVSRGNLNAKFWGEECDVNNNLEVYIRRLRRKLPPLPDNFQAIQTRRDIGYEFVVRQGDNLLEASREFDD